MIWNGKWLFNGQEYVHHNIFVHTLTDDKVIPKDQRLSSFLRDIHACSCYYLL